MPELPEMQALAERLSDAVAGSQLEALELLQFSALKTVKPAPDELYGREVGIVGRRGKYLVIEFGGPRLLVHLSQGGRVSIEEPPKRTKPKGAVLRLRFTGRPALLVKEFGTERKAGCWMVAEGDEGPLAKLGPEPGDERFREFVRTSDDRRRVHTILRDQSTVAGLGRGYTDDALHRAQMSPYASLASLGAEERERLLEAIDETLAQGLAEERLRTGGLPTKLGDHWVVHGKFGHPCPACGDDLRRVSYESHDVTYCPRCQTGGKVLADRRLSRLVR